MNELSAQDAGRLAESLALRFYERQGAEPLARNYRAGRAEIDLIVREGETVVFVEVKFRASNAFGHPEQTLGDAQRERILEAAEAFLEENALDAPVRFDVAAVSKSPEGYRLERFRDAFF